MNLQAQVHYQAALGLSEVVILQMQDLVKAGTNKLKVFPFLEAVFISRGQAHDKTGRPELAAKEYRQSQIIGQQIAQEKARQAAILKKREAREAKLAAKKKAAEAKAALKLEKKAVKPTPSKSPASKVKK